VVVSCAKALHDIIVTAATDPLSQDAMRLMDAPCSKLAESIVGKSGATGDASILEQVTG
jgi:hypothetical protein